jgi:hypothetical protein
MVFAFLSLVDGGWLRGLVSANRLIDSTCGSAIPNTNRNPRLSGEADTFTHFIASHIV